VCASRSDGKRIGRLHPVFSLDWLWRARVTPAAAAGVSAQSVHKAFGTKPALLKSVSDVAIAGEDEPVPVPPSPASGSSPTLAASCGATVAGSPRP
jgi:hypothetical protein